MRGVQRGLVLGAQRRLQAVNIAPLEFQRGGVASPLAQVVREPDQAVAVIG